VLVYILLTAAFTGILFGLLPLHSLARRFRRHCHGKRARSSAGFDQSKARSTLVVMEIALSLILLADAALLIRTLTALWTVDPGFDPHDVLTLEMPLA